jgi:hypothetical protein
VEAGLELFGVPVGVPFGVFPALSTRDFREDDLGVMLELRKACTGVEMPSFGVDVGFGESVAEGPPPGRRSIGERDDVVDPAIRGVNGGRPVLGGALSFGINGREASGLLL